MCVSVHACECTLISVCGKNWYRSQTLEFGFQESRAKQIYISRMDKLCKVLVLGLMLPGERIQLASGLVPKPLLKENQVPWL